MSSSRGLWNPRDRCAGSPWVDRSSTCRYGAAFSDLAPALPHRRRAGTRTPLPSLKSSFHVLLPELLQLPLELLQLPLDLLQVPPPPARQPASPPFHTPYLEDVSLFFAV